jgi:hypothetical protein
MLMRRKRQPDLAVSPDKCVIDADGSTILRAPHQYALGGIQHQLIDLVVTQGIDGDHLVIVCLGHTHYFTIVASS